MQSYKGSFIAALVALVILHVSCESTFGNGLFICKEGKLAPGETFREKLKACNDPDLYKDKDLKCIAVCTTEAIGGLKDGIPDKGLFTDIVKNEFPGSEQADALERLEKCFEERTFDKDDKNCTSIAEFSACGTKLVVETKC